MQSLLICCNHEILILMQVNGGITVTDMVKFVCEYIEKDNLGVIDNTHKALSDSQGMDSESCITLAELHSLAVDAPKTGKWAKVSREILVEVKDAGYPDFMMKASKKTYESVRILGKIFRRSKRCSSATQIAASGQANIGQKVLPGLHNKCKCAS